MQDGFTYEALLDQLKEGVCVVDAQRGITFWNTGAERITGFQRNEAKGLGYADGPLQHCDKLGQPRFAGETPIDTCLRDGVSHEFELYLRRKDGSLAPVFSRVSPVNNTRGEVIGALEVFSDNSTKVQALERIEELEEMALVCPTTGVGNRRYTQMTIASAFDELKRYGSPLGVLFVDVDHFKRINDIHGHAIGDQVLRMVAHAMRNTLRSFDFVGRWGGEEFVVLLPNITDDILLRVAKRCREHVEESRFQSGGEEIGTTVSIGAIMADANETPDACIERADRMMYCAKSDGRNRICVDL